MVDSLNTTNYCHCSFSTSQPLCVSFAFPTISTKFNLSSTTVRISSLVLPRSPSSLPRTPFDVLSTPFSHFPPRARSPTSSLLALTETYWGRRLSRNGKMCRLHKNIINIFAEKHAQTLDMMLSFIAHVHYCNSVNWL